MNSHPKFKTGGWRIRPREERTILLLGDLMAALGALIGALFLWGIIDPYLDLSAEFIRQRVDLWFFALPLIWLVLLVELYDLHRSHHWRRTLQGIAYATSIGALFFSLIYLFSPPNSLTRWGVGGFLLFAAASTTVWRFLYIRIFTAPTVLRRVLIIGAGKAGKTLIQVFKDLQPPPFLLIGLIDDDPAKQGRDCEGIPILGGSDRLLEIIQEKAVSELIIAVSGEMRGATFQTILDAQERGIEITPMPTMYEELTSRVPIRHLESEWLIRSFVNEARVSGFYEIGKRMLDIVGALVGLVLLGFLFPLVAAGIVIESGFPVLYRQIRSGKGGKTYFIYKFRTMRQDAEKDGRARLTEENDARITRFGAFLRRTHIDELPQFWNVLLGDMSLVGPRAERPEWIETFQKQIPFYRARLLVKPGITGWAQVNYSYYATIEEMTIKLEYDLYYIKHRNLFMDIILILRTIGQVLGLRGR